LPCYVFGYISFVHSHHPHHENLDLRAVKCVYIGYLLNKKEFKCYYHLSIILEELITKEAHDVVKREDQYYVKQYQSILKNLIVEVIDNMTIAFRKGKQLCVKNPISQSSSSQSVCTSRLFVQHQSSIVAIDNTYISLGSSKR
ncbi:hypothetical protein CR513_46088, partial [Mucuna pruriens]